MWEELERWKAATAFVRYSGGGGSRGRIGAVTLEDRETRVLARWGVGEGELPEALAAPIWARYALFRGHPRITGLVMWDLQERHVLIGGERGDRTFEEVLVRKPLARAHLAPSTLPGGAMTVHPAPPFVAGEHPAWQREPAKQAERPPCD